MGKLLGFRFETLGMNSGAGVKYRSLEGARVEPA